MVRQLILIVILFVCGNSFLFAQHAPEPLYALFNDTSYTNVVDQMPVYPGGEKAFREYIVHNINFPLDDRYNGIEGKVEVSYYIEVDGSVNDISIVHGLSDACNKEAIRIISNMPKWNPGYRGGNKVRLKLTTPVYFRIGTKIDNRYNYINNTNFSQGVAQLDFEDYKKAIKFFEIVVKDNKELIDEARANIAICKLNLNDLDQAAKLLDKVRGNDETAFRLIVADIYLELGNKFFDREDYNKAITYYTLGIEESSENIDLFYNRGTAYYNLGKLSKSCSDWNRIKSYNLPDVDKFLEEHCGK
jgi:TonB family protein